MIPQFPEFKKLELSDKKEVERYTEKYPPYSDFTFTSLWTWDTDAERRISELNGNLVVRFTDYITNEPFLSFLGSRNVTETAETLINFMQSNSMGSFLKLVPEISIRQINATRVLLHEDRDHFDYIFSPQKLSEFLGKTYDTKRNMINRFLRGHPNAEARIIDLTQQENQEHIQSLLETWILNKNKYNDDLDEAELKNEMRAIKRLFSEINNLDLVGIGVFSGEELLAFSITEELHEKYAVCHFAKANVDHAGAYEYLIREEAKHLVVNKLHSLNYEQDLGLPGLRAVKNSLRPEHFLKKYKIAIRKQGVNSLTIDSA
jgi:uncharacterized protein